MFYTVKDYWVDVRAAESSLPEFTFITSIEDRLIGRTGGVVAEVGRAVAAMSIVAKMHRLSTPAEVARHKDAEQQRNAAAAAEVRRKAGHCTFVLPPAVKGK